ncbi:P-loop NTPase family protein [Mucilaginibacter kameinonensis]|uniref:hypothetical protein n=1 Tax=Mucilaginibacter kameinonensis TaxID=452286 RepID=UPI000EF7D404|nr:hypothetical protein [Mucilaginibacter kameinonensis]
METKGMFQVGQMVFDRLDLETIWKNTIGLVDKNFSCAIWGGSGNGKTTGILRLLKALCDCGLRATYVSLEEGHSATMQDALRREGIIDHYSGKIILAANATFEEVVEYFCRRGSPDVAVIDSIDVWKMTPEQFLYMRKKLKNKIIILIMWSLGSEPKTQSSKDIKYLCDVKLFVKNFMIWPKSRFGGNIPQAIWEERARLLEHKYFDRLDKMALKLAKAAQNTPEQEGVFANE